MVEDLEEADDVKGLGGEEAGSHDIADDVGAYSRVGVFDGVGARLDPVHFPVAPRERLVEEEAVAAADFEQGAFCRPVYDQVVEIAAVSAPEVLCLGLVSEIAAGVEFGKQFGVGYGIGAHEAAAQATDQAEVDTVGQAAGGEDLGVERLWVEVSWVELPGSVDRAADGAPCRMEIYCWQLGC